MNTAEERLQKRRYKNLAEKSQRDYDYSKTLFFGGMLLLFVFSVFFYKVFSITTVKFLLVKLGQPEELEQLSYAVFAVAVGVIGYFFGQIVALIFIRRIAKKYQGNIFFGTHPVRNMVLACFFFYNILFYLFLGVFAIFKGF